MLCPACKSPLALDTFEGLELDVCHRCGGVWFDEGELAKFISSSSENVSTFAESLEGAPQQLGHLQRRCPKCERVLETFHYAYSSPVLIDTCPDCRGVFVDQPDMELMKTYLDAVTHPDPREEVALAFAQLQIGVQSSRARALQVARSLFVRRMSGSHSYWQLGLEPQDKP